MPTLTPSDPPRAKPARDPLTTALRAAARHKTPEGALYRRALAEALWTRALQGNLAAARLILEYLVGRPTPRPEPSAAAGGVVVNLILPGLEAQAPNAAARQLSLFDDANAQPESLPSASAVYPVEGAL